MSRKLKSVIPAALLLLCGCTRSSEPARELKAALNLSSTEMTYLDTTIKGLGILPKTRIVLEPNQGIDPASLLMGQNQPDVFELDYKDLKRLAPKALPLDRMFTDEYERSVFSLNCFEPGVISGRHLFLPFRLRWLALLYNAERVSEVPQDLKALAGLCASHPGGLGLCWSDDYVLAEFILSLIWAFNGNPFDLENANTKKALYFLASLNPCLISYSGNYDADSLAQALAKGEIDFAFAELDTARLLWENGSFPYPIAGAAFPGRTPLAFTGSYLGVNKNSAHPAEAYALAFNLTEPKSCEKIIGEGLWLCSLPSTSQPSPPPARVELFKPYLASLYRLRPPAPGVDFASLAKIYRELFKRLVVQPEPVELVSAELRLKLKQLEAGLSEK